MKKSIIITLALVSAFIISGCGGEDKKTAPAPKSAATQQSEAFKQVGYYKSKNNDRSFCVYTTTKDKNEMIKHARTKAHTDGRTTTVHFFDDEKNTPDNTLLKNDNAAMWLDTKDLTDNHKKHMLGTYQKAITGKEFWHDKATATKESTMNPTEIK